MAKIVNMRAAHKKKDPRLSKKELASSLQRKPVSFTATEAKNEFGRLLERAIQGDSIVITRHEKPKAVLISIDEYNALKRIPDAQLAALNDEFDAMYERMQTPNSRAAVRDLFSATPGDLGKAAVIAATKRG